MNTAWGGTTRISTHGPDFKWVLAAQAGYTLAFKELVARYEKRIYHFALTILRDAADAETVRNNTLMHVSERLQEFRGDSRFSTWVLGMAAKEALQRFREKHADPLVIDQSTEAQNGQPDNCRENFTRDELDCFLSEGVDVLEPVSRAVFLLCDLENCPSEEVAGLLELPLAAVKSHLLRARHEVDEHLDWCSKRGINSVPSYSHARGEG